MWEKGERSIQRGRERERESREKRLISAAQQDPVCVPWLWSLLSPQREVQRNVQALPRRNPIKSMEINFQLKFFNGL